MGKLSVINIIYMILIINHVKLNRFARLIGDQQTFSGCLRIMLHINSEAIAVNYIKQVINFP